MSGLVASVRRLPLLVRVAGAVVLGLVALRAVVGLVPQDERPGGPQSSAFATGPDGVAAYADLLDESGRGVRLERRRLAEAELDPSTTLLVLDPPALSTDDAEALVAFVEDGGTLVASGPTADRWLRDLLPAPATWEDGPAALDGVVLPVAPVPEVAGVDAVATAGAGHLDLDASSLLPALAGSEGAAAGVAAVGEGRVVVLADASPLWNGLLDRADDAAFGLALVPPGGVAVFAEQVHGYGTTTGLAALPASARVAGAGVALAILLLYLAAARRLGPPLLVARELPPPRAAYADALALTLARTEDRGRALAPLRAEGVRVLAGRSAQDGEPAALRARARDRGVPDDEIDALLGEGGDDATMLRVGRAVARLARDGGGGG